MPVLVLFLLWGIFDIVKLFHSLFQGTRLYPLEIRCTAVTLLKSFWPFVSRKEKAGIIGFLVCTALHVLLDIDWVYELGDVFIQMLRDRVYILDADWFLEFAVLYGAGSYALWHLSRICLGIEDKEEEELVEDE